MTKQYVRAYRRVIGIFEALDSNPREADGPKSRSALR
jgi:hypothetical protein